MLMALIQRLIFLLINNLELGIFEFLESHGIFALIITITNQFCRVIIHTYELQLMSLQLQNCSFWKIIFQHCITLQFEVILVLHAESQIINLILTSFLSIAWVWNP